MQGSHDRSARDISIVVKSRHEGPSSPPDQHRHQNRRGIFVVRQHGHERAMDLVSGCVSEECRNASLTLPAVESAHCGQRRIAYQTKAQHSSGTPRSMQESMSYLAGTDKMPLLCGKAVLTMNSTFGAAEVRFKRVKPRSFRSPATSSD